MRLIHTINLLAPGFEYEVVLGASTTVNVNPYLTGGYNSLNGWMVFPGIRGQFRKYYNLLRRQAKGKKTARDSSNFFEFSAFGVGQPIFSTEDIRDGNYYGSYYGIGAIRGLQRTYRGKLNIRLSGGVDYGFSTYSSSSGVATILNFRLGWVLSKQSFR